MLDTAHHVGVGAHHQVRACVDQGVAVAGLAVRGGIDLFLAPVNHYQHQVAFRPRGLHHFGQLRFGIIPFGDADTADGNALHFRAPDALIAAIAHARVFQHLSGLQQPRLAEIQGVVVGQPRHLHRGTRQNLHIGRIALEIENPSAPLFLFRGQRAFQVHKGQIVPFKDGTHVLQKIVHAVGLDAAVKALVSAGVVIAPQGHVPGGGNGDGSQLRFRFQGGHLRLRLGGDFRLRRLGRFRGGLHFGLLSRFRRCFAPSLRGEGGQRGIRGVRNCAAGSGIARRGDFHVSIAGGPGLVVSAGTIGQHDDPDQRKHAQRGKYRREKIQSLLPSAAAKRGPAAGRFLHFFLHEELHYMRFDKNYTALRRKLVQMQEIVGNA